MLESWNDLLNDRLFCIKNYPKFGISTVRSGDMGIISSENVLHKITYSICEKITTLFSSNTDQDE